MDLLDIAWPVRFYCKVGDLYNLLHSSHGASKAWNDMVLEYEPANTDFLAKETPLACYECLEV